MLRTINGLAANSLLWGTGNFVGDIRDFSFRISELFPEISEVPEHRNPDARFARAAFQPGR
jgi:hypothetical protein